MKRKKLLKHVNLFLPFHSFILFILCRFHVVQFDPDGTVEIVPENWILNGKCAWPPISKPAAIKKLVTMFAEPAENWASYGFVSLKKTRELFSVFICEFLYIL